MNKLFSRENSKGNGKGKGKQDKIVAQETDVSTKEPPVIGEAKVGQGNWQPPISSSSTRPSIYVDTPVKSSDLNSAASEYVPSGKLFESGPDVATTVLPEDLLPLQETNKQLQLELETQLAVIARLQKSVNELSEQNVVLEENAAILRQRATDAAVASDEHGALVRTLEALKAEKEEIATALARQEEAYLLELTAKDSSISSMRQESEEQYSALSQAFEQYKLAHPVIGQIEEKDQAVIEQPESEHATIILQLQRELAEKVLEINLLKRGDEALHLTSEEDEPRRAQLESVHAAKILELERTLEEITIREARLLEEAELKLSELTQKLIAQQREASERIDQLELLLNEKDEQIGLRQKGYEAEFLELNAQREHQEQQLEGLNDALQAEQELLESKEQELREYTDKILEMDRAIFELQAHQSRLGEVVSELESELDAKIHHIGELEYTASQKSEQLAALVTYRVEMESFVDAQEQTIRQLQDQVQQMELGLESARRLQDQEMKTISREGVLATENEESAESLVDNSVVETQANTILQHLSRIAALEQEVLSSSQALNKATEDAALLRNQLSFARSSERPLQQSTSAAFFANSQAREKKAVDAIADLEKEIVVGSLLNRDKAIKAIVDRLKESLSKDDPQAYFNEHKEDLRRQLGVLNNWKSVLCTAVNAIVTVLAVLSVAGITALWLTGNLKNNATKNGSSFAFYVADKQKGNRAIQEVTEALSCRVGG